jgi:hypothetical protein
MRYLKTITEKVMKGCDNNSESGGGGGSSSSSSSSSFSNGKHISIPFIINYVPSQELQGELKK